MVGDQTSADNRLASFAVSPINGNNEAFGINEVCSVNQRRPAAFSGEVPLAKAGRFLPTQSSSCRVNTIRNQDQFHPVQQRAQITSSTTTSFSTISSARNASSRLISAASRKCRMAPPSNSSNILDNASGTSAGTGCLGGATGALGATNVSGSTTTTAAAAAGGGGGGSSSSRNWLHQDNEILGQGVCYTVKYVGCLEVLTSMKSLDFDTRTLIAKECIVRVCESAGLRSADRKRKIDRRLNRVLAEKPIMEHAGANVSLRINSSSLSLTDLETNQSVASHSMPNISFASGGDQDTLDFVAYVGKDARQSRACFVLECGGGLAQEVIATIGQAFELRFRELMRRSPVVQGSNCATSSGSGSGPAAPPFVPLPPKDPDYYNDLPGKTPPEHHRPLPMSNVVSAAPPSGDGSSPINNNNTAAMKPSGDNLIDFENSDPIPDHPAPPPNHEYVNQSIINNTLDVFDMRPMDQVLSPATSTLTQQSGTQSQIPITGPPQQIAHIAADTGETQTLSQAPDSNQAPPPYVVASIEQHLLMEPWYHGAISRAESEKLLARDGDFLVRESRGQRGQFVLTGLQAGQGRHLLLIDPHGVVRTKDRTFSSVSHLIHFHRDNQLPILSADSALLLVRPIMHSKFAGPVGATGNKSHLGPKLIFRRIDNIRGCWPKMSVGLSTEKIIRVQKLIRRRSP
ncbi:SHC-transforming protein 1-like isoform X2 [Varroa jacobsoni]|nr:SHC-transforming protein 1-like isoform X2 [Varroa jacobsoni]XP_022695100.1 SHC-transforming protein 1-like isoform X2 [Varroa jacobsoni]